MDPVSLMAAGEFSWLSPGSWGAIVQVVLGVGFVIFVHELGHFLVAKACGVKCEKFYVGFDFFDLRIGDRVIVPRSLLKFHYGETEYGIGIVPLGGYVKMLGQEDNPAQMQQESQRARGRSGAAPEDSLPAGVEAPARLDPRSFMAKSVPQRMAIISAGVIFNLFFAILFAAMAFRSGATYVPPVVGSTVVGGPAWRAGMNGSIIQSVNNKPADAGYHPYSDLVQETMLHGSDRPMSFELLRPGRAEPETIEVTPETGVVRGIDLPLLGMQPEMAARIGDSPDAIIPGQAASRAEPPLQPGDAIVQINGRDLQHFVRDGRKLVPITELKARLAELIDQPVSLSVLRGGTQAVAVVPPNPAPTPGFTFEATAIVAVQSDSPADLAGLEAGDRIVAVAGQPVSDWLALDQQIVRWMRDHEAETPARPELELRVIKSGSSEESTVTVRPRAPREGTLPGADPFAVSTLGIACNLRPVIATVTPGSAAEAAGLRPGDRVRKMKVLVPRSRPASGRRDDLLESIRRARRDGFPFVCGEAAYYLREFPAGTAFEFVIERDGRRLPPVRLRTELSPDTFLPTRGMMLTPLESVYRSTDWRESLALGARQTWLDAGRIWRALGKLVTGQIALTNLGGPGTIAIAATMEATEGTSRLLLFLTMLSANLAIINFLPIPVLDGGHMMFLAYEGIFRRPVTERVQVALSYLGLFLILGLMVFVFSLDISRIIRLF